jgi:hypothetical protein
MRQFTIATPKQKTERKVRTRLGCTIKHAPLAILVANILPRDTIAAEECACSRIALEHVC